MYFEDLTEYKYLKQYSEDYRNVGWLSSAYSYPTGSVSDKFLAALEQLCKTPVNLCLGRHACQLCPIPPGIVGYWPVKDFWNTHNLYGNGEIHVVGQKNRVYVAPTLVYHYVKVHSYLPPEEFIQAVLAEWIDS